MTSRAAKRAFWVAGVLGIVLLVRLTLFRPADVPFTVFRAASGRVEETVTNSKAGTSTSTMPFTCRSQARSLAGGAIGVLAKPCARSEGTEVVGRRT